VHFVQYQIWFNGYSTVTRELSVALCVFVRRFTGFDMPPQSKTAESCNEAKTSPKLYRRQKADDKTGPQNFA
jgi:hypothetical protein